ncbi:S8 family peptidase [Streptomyces sp. NBC_00872]|uniref:S8 family peptidase n=1 Tax=Streptomyces sp. NBC_00872 TaxID=2903686 RepID=UPI003864F330|nr:S8 family peptidase [Streptomyces sp. NBC_00872]
MRLRTRWAPAALLLLVPLLSGTDAMAGPGGDHVPVERSARAVPHQYIVTLKPALSPADAVRRLGLDPLFTYETTLRGFAAVLTPSQLGAVRALPGVAAVEENGRVSVTPPLTGRPPARTRGAVASWGLDRIDQRNLPLDNDFTVTGTGRGVTAYIVDTGIETAHSEFGGRAAVGFDTVPDRRQGQDCHGHGTHVAGTAGGAVHGVARAVSLVAVRVLDCRGNGTWAGILAGFDWIAKNAKGPAVLNASLGGPSSKAVDDAVDAIAARGVLPVVAAGNESADACAVSPAGAGQVITVGATDRQDRETEFSNYGECVSTYAPGAAIVSAGLGGGAVAQSGTSMASPHVAGVAVLYKEKHPDASPRDIARWLAGQSSKNVLTPISKGSPNRLLHTGGL